MSVDSNRILDGKMVAAKIREQIKDEVVAFVRDHGIKPGLAVVIVGSDPASKVYVNKKKKTCEEIGMYSEVIALPEETSMETLLEVVNNLNERKEIHGILVQLPLPKHLDTDTVLNTINPLKDVDGFHPINAGKLFIGEEGLVPCTPYGVIKMLEQYNISVEGKKAVVIGRSNIVGKPMAALLLARNATVTICHSRTKDLAAVAREADILVAAIGRPNYVTKDIVKPGSIVIDV